MTVAETPLQKGKWLEKRQSKKKSIQREETRKLKISHTVDPLHKLFATFTSSRNN